MSNEGTTLEDFGNILDGLKLNQTANTFRKELEKQMSINNFQSSLKNNPFLTTIMKHLSKVQNTSQTTQSQTPEISTDSEKLKNTKIYQELYNNFDSLIYKENSSNQNDILINNTNINKGKNKLIDSKDGSSMNNNKNKPKNKKTKIQFQGTDTEIEESKHENTANNNNSMSLTNKNNNTEMNQNDNDNEEDSMFNNLNTSESNGQVYKKIDNRKINEPKPFAGNSQLDKILKIQNIKIENVNENSGVIDSSSFFQNSQCVLHDDHNNKDIRLDKSELEDEYVDDDDPGFDLYECDREYNEDTSKKLSEQYGFPARAIYKSKFNDLIRPDRDNKEKDKDKGKDGKDNDGVKFYLPKTVKFMKSNNPYYPIMNNNVCLDCFNMKMVVDREKIGFEPEKEMKFKPNMLIAGRYKYIKELGDAAFSVAIQCYDILENRMVCIKVIKNNKDYFDQSIDEIKLLRYINANGDPDGKCFLRMFDYFYYKEHLMIVSELLKDNLYDFYKYINDHNIDYFTIPKIQKLTKQILICLEFIHSLKIIHCDLKPENILMKSITEATCKVIDFGSSCFIHDHLSTYIQSRSYRAPEVIIGCKYDYKIDMWSLGCILAEIYTGNVLFQNDSVQSMLARIIGICGPIPDWMFEKGKLVNDFFTKEKLIFMEPNENNNSSSFNQTSSIRNEKSKKIHILVPKKSSLKRRLKTSDDYFYDFVKNLLEIDPNLRMSATQALNHPWIKDVKYPTS